ncbi:MarR family winged helix-turn-helix transcriptional regulator [Arcanobacterium haemolyticum]|uniref:Transcriptional regulator, MarR family n=1 Tax=Arcanobacterium haemolyticum (strain ATCC 9345 / DSM 20595 / CCM 5947 / CCUG 17215 / LMG 16163 / NBRC 15585 / NCTC 8452 / 11018) TaxID=644284 RepID=D7BKU2_ARCHD|nr:MarR family transcriptional regulator [Arcanobacterium haemolyticum]ADH93272.1 transcriptional regulator, MarR family [Arcanobacterium haemolyticum DSM 20595]SPT75837.1 MarR family [Arcanobacterium haemolyticum]SQH27906.1 MarR family [Arcanobacterium haemolyticum]
MSETKLTGATERDDVDTIIDGWVSQRPDLAPEPFAIFSRLLRLTRHVERMRKTVFARHGLETWEFEMLAALRRTPEHTLTAGQLMKETLVSSGTVTNRLDRMAAKGLLERKSDDRDGRVVYVKAAEKGLFLVDAAVEDLLSTEARIIEPYTLAENAEAAAYMRRLLRYFETDATAA